MTKSNNAQKTVGELKPTALILHVEDDPSIAEVVRALFKNHEFKIDVCDSAESALRLLQTNSYDLLLLDIVLPGLSGKELSDKLPELFESPPPVIFISALAKDYEREATKNRFWEKAYIQKPIPYAELIAAVGLQVQFSKIRSFEGSSFPKSDDTAKKASLVSHVHSHLLESQSFVQSAPFVAGLISSLSHEMGSSLLIIQSISSMLKDKNYLKTHSFDEESQLLIGASNNISTIMKGLVELVRSGFGGQRNEITLELMSIKDVLSFSIFVSSAFLAKQDIKTCLSIHCEVTTFSCQLGEMVKLILYAVDEFHDANKNIRAQKIMTFFARMDGKKCVFGVAIESEDGRKLNPLNLQSHALLCARAIAEHRGLNCEVIDSGTKHSIELITPYQSVTAASS